MRELTLRAAEGQTRILVGGQLADLATLSGARRVVVITDERVMDLYAGEIVADDIIVTAGGEDHKNLRAVSDIYDQLLHLGCDRSTLIVGVGGGIVCDIAGFAAATFLRGTSLGLIPTTLLAQVDAAIGGKNGVNLHGYKNMIGTFCQPEFVLVCPQVLHTLPRERRSEGFAELLKAAVIADAALFERLEADVERFIDLADDDFVAETLLASIGIKASIVSADPREAGTRMLLNLGHTIGHALEKSVPGLWHGRAVAVGMVTAARRSVARGLLSQADFERIVAVIERAGLPTQLPNLDAGTIEEALGKDKKRRHGHHNVVVVQGIGKAVVEQVSGEELDAWVEDVCESGQRQPANPAPAAGPDAVR